MTGPDAGASGSADPDAGSTSMDRSCETILRVVAQVQEMDDMRRAARTDANHEELVDALRAVGATVTSLAAVGDGCPDLLVGYRHRTYAIEVKDGSLPPSAQLLTPAQKRWHTEWRGDCYVARTVADALAIIGLGPKAA